LALEDGVFLATVPTLGILVGILHTGGLADPGMSAVLGVICTGKKGSK